MRRRTPTRLQFQTTECGVGVLRMMLAYFGREVDAEDVRRVTGVSRDCVSAADIVLAAKHYRLNCKALRREPERLPLLGFPIVVHLRFIHFAVIEGMDDRYVYLNDPATGRIEIPIERFRQDFTGIALTFEPEPDFRRSRYSPRNHIGQLAGYLTALREWRVGIAVLATVAAVLPLLWFASLVASWTDLIAVAPMQVRRHFFLIAVTASLLLRAGCEATAAVFWPTGKIAVSETWSSRFLRHLLSLPPSFFVYRAPQRLYDTSGSIDTVSTAEVTGLMPALADLATVPLILAALFQFNKTSALALLFAFACAGLAMIGLSRWRSGTRRYYRAQGAAALFGLLDGLDRIEQSKLGDGDHTAFQTNIGLNARKEILRQHSDLALMLKRLIPGLFVFSAFACTTVLGGYAVIHHQTSVGSLLAMLILAAALCRPLKQLASLQDAVETVRSAAPHIADVLACTPDAADVGNVGGAPNTAKEAGSRSDDAARLVNISFGYSRTRPPLLQDLSLDIKAGEQLGITGPSGGGKSTLAGLLIGLHRPWSGVVELAGRPLQMIEPQTRARMIAWIGKTSFFFEGTIRENLCLWDEDIDDDALREAIADSCLADVLAARPAGIDTPVAPEGRNFSGGQRQRLVIARALLRRPAIIVLDEATSGLDPDLEHRVRANLRRRGCTLVIISHRASTLAACDRVLTVTGGRWGQSLPIPPAAEPRLAEPPSGGMPIAGSTRRSHLFEAFRQVAAAIGQAVTLPDSILETDEAGMLSEFARHNALHYRRVRFAVPSWWRGDHGPLIAFAGASGEPLAILPSRGESVRVDSATGIARYGGDELSPLAYALYPRGRWAGTPIRAWLGDAIGLARLDFVRAGALAIAMGAGSMVPTILVWQLLSAGERGDTLPSSARFALTLSLVAAALGVLAVAWSIAVLRFEGRLRLSALVRLVQRFNRIDVQFLRGLTPETAARALVAGPHLLDRVIDLPTRQCLDGSIALAGLAVLAWFRWDLAGLAVLLMLPPLLLPLLSAHLKLRTERLHTDTRLAQQRFLSALFLGIAQLRGLGAADRAVRHWQRLKARQREAGRKLEQRKLLASACGRTYSWIAPTLLTAYGIAEARIDAVVLPALFMAAWLLFEAVGRGGARLAAATMAKPLAQDAAILLDGPTDSEDRPTSSTSLEPIDFDHVCYRYPDSAAAVLDSLTLRVEPGAILAIIGPSGCGKSTLLRLLLGFDVPSAGSIVRDSARSGRSGLAAWRAGVGAVLQGERIQVASTIRSQIGGLAPCSLAGIWHAAELAGVADDIRALPMGMQTIVEPDNISTGQEQRILIARQLVGRPRLLVLDEATNAIPEQMQVELLANLRALGLTTILVTHRQSAIARADRVIMLDAGAIIFSGTPEQLAAQPQLRLLETEAMIAE